jgi:hypothetical protein
VREAGVPLSMEVGNGKWKSGMENEKSGMENEEVGNGKCGSREWKIWKSGMENDFLKNVQVLNYGFY